MKKVFTVMVLAMITMQLATARNNGSIVNLRLSDNSPFRVFIDGRQVGGVSKTAMLVNMAQGRYFIEVYPVGNTWKNERRSRNFKGNLIVERNTESFITIFPEYRKLQYDRVVALNNHGRKGWNDRSDRNHPPHPRADFQEPCGPTQPIGPVAMNPVDFQTLKRTIDNGSFESTKLNIFKQALAYNYFTSAQVRELMNMFYFESSKLEVAKLAYAKTIDQNNYYTLNNEFSFSSSVNELGKYVAMK